MGNDEEDIKMRLFGNPCDFTVEPLVNNIVNTPQTTEDIPR